MPKEVVREVIKEVVREVPVEVPVEVCAHRLKMKTVPSASGLLRTAHKRSTTPWFPHLPPPQVIKEVPVEVVRTVIKEVPKETIKEVPVEVIKEVIVEAPYEVIKEVQVEVIKEVIKEVPVEVIKEVEKVVYKDKPPEEIIKYVDREVIREGPLASATSRLAATWSSRSRPRRDGHVSSRRRPCF